MKFLVKNHVIAWWSEKDGKVKTFDLKKFVYPTLGILAFLILLGAAGVHDIRR